MNLQFPEENNNNINFEDNFPSSKKDTKKNLQNEYLNKYTRLYNDYFSERELIDIFERNNYNENKIINDINSLLLIENNRNSDKDNNDIEKHYSPSFGHNINSKISSISNKDDKKDKLLFQKDSDIPSDYDPPPKNDENNNIKVINNNVLLEYKKNLFNKLRINNTYKSYRDINDELLYDGLKRERTQYSINKKENELIEIEHDKNKNNNNNNLNFSPNPKSQIFQFKQDNNINKDKKKNKLNYFLEI